MQALYPTLFWLLAAVTGACAIGVVVTQNIVRSATWLLFTLAGTSGIFFLLGADFVAATQLLVYVGGTLVLVVFGVMLTAQGPFISLRTSAVEWAVSIVVGALLFGVLAVCLLYYPPLPESSNVMTRDPAHSKSSAILGQALLGVKEATPEADLTGLGERPVAAAGQPKRVEFLRRKQVAYLLPFEIVSVHLLVVLIGAAYLARAKRRRGVATP